MNESKPVAVPVETPADVVVKVKPSESMSPLPSSAPKTARLYRCYNCAHPTKNIPGRDFTVITGEAIECPVCGITKPGKAEGRIAEVELIHLEELESDKIGRIAGVGVGHIACDETVKVGTGIRASDDIRAVTCPECAKIATDKDQTARKFNRDYDFKIGPEHVPTKGP